MKIKMILFFLITILFIILINYKKIDNKIYYVSIGEETIFKNKILKNKKIEKIININKNDYRITDIINDILDNNNDIQTHLIKADRLVINISNNELKYKMNNLNYNYIDQMIIDLDKLFSIIRIYTKEKIYFINPDNSDDKYIKYLNDRLIDILKKYKIEFININWYNYNEVNKKWVQK